MDKEIPMHIVAVCGLIQKGDKYLVAKRASNDSQAGGQWSIPGGKQEFELGDDIIEETLKREVMEEVGLEIDEQVVYLSSQGFTHSTKRHVVMLYFLCKYKAGIAKPLEDQEEIRWVTHGELEKLVNAKDGPNYLKEPVSQLKII